MAVDFNVQAAFVFGREYDRFDHRAQNRGHLALGIWVGQRRCQVGNLFSVLVGNLRVEGDNRQCLQFLHVLFDGVPFQRGRCQRLADVREIARAVGDGRYQSGHLGLRVGELVLHCRVAAGQIARPSGVVIVIFAHIFSDDIRMQHAFCQAVQHPPFNIGGGDRPAVAAYGAAAFAFARTSPAVTRLDRVAAATFSTFQKARQQLARALLLMDWTSGQMASLFLRGLPDILIDNPQMGHGVNLPFAFGAWADADLARARVDDFLRAPDHQFSAIEPVSEKAVAALGTAIDATRAPEIAVGWRYLVGVQILCDLARAAARCIFFKNAADDFGMFGMDFPKAANRATAIINLVGGSIAIGDARRGKALFSAALLRAADIVRQILTLLFVQQAFDRAAKGVNLSIGKGEQARASKVDAFADVVGVPLIAGDAAGAVGQHLFNVAALHALQHGMHAGALVFIHARAAADGVVGEHVNDIPALGVAAFAAHRYLVINRPAILQIA